jgi:hypothetical protein
MILGWGQSFAAGRGCRPPGAVTCVISSSLADGATNHAREATITKKFHAMNGTGDSEQPNEGFLRYPVYCTSMDAPSLLKAITSCFQGRGTAVPIDAPIALTRDSLNHPQKEQKWNAFVCSPPNPDLE